MLCEGDVRWIQIQTLYFLPACMHIWSRMFVIPSFLSFCFLSKQDGYGTKVVVVSIRFENPLSKKSVILDGIQLKTQNMAFKSFIDDLTVLQCRYYYFHTPRKVDGEGFLWQISTLKTVPSDKKSNCRTCAEGCQMPFKYFWDRKVLGCIRRKLMNTPVTGVWL